MPEPLEQGHRRPRTRLPAGHLARPSVPQTSIKPAPTHTLPPGSSPHSIYYLFPPRTPGDPTALASHPPQPVLEALQMTSRVSVFIYRAYDFNFSIKKSEQG
ncbi:Hypothetical predicted protein [Marmota monax]|uniref:Uncharacterized protein n=1 Tax=Marmota monax TaxID=9995 RepID=A0A5E4BH59_MARMO|nr:Hypothetical predicted protein [Marmota monax]